MMQNRQRRRIVRAAAAFSGVNGDPEQYAVPPESDHVVRQSCRAVGQWLPGVPVPPTPGCVRDGAPATDPSQSATPATTTTTTAHTMSHSLSLSVPESFFCMPQCSVSQLSSLSLSMSTSRHVAGALVERAGQGESERPAEVLQLPGAMERGPEGYADIADEPALADSPALDESMLGGELLRGSHPDAVVCFIAATPIPRRATPTGAVCVTPQPTSDTPSPGIQPAPDGLTSANLSANTKLLKPKRHVAFALPCPRE
jgi:hypothetical protein